jgi:predicted aspartyl protease
MGITHLRVTLGRTSGKGRKLSVRFMIDSGALYSVLPENAWRALKLRPERKAEFFLADGTVITRGVSECRFEMAGQAATSPVVLGEGDDGALLGAVTLETLGLMLNPLNRELVPMRLMLGARPSNRSRRISGGAGPSAALRLLDDVLRHRLRRRALHPARPRSDLLGPGHSDGLPARRR